MEYEKIIFNFPKEYKRKLEKVVAMENVENEKIMEYIKSQENYDN